MRTKRQRIDWRDAARDKEHRRHMRLKLLDYIPWRQTKEQRAQFDLLFKLMKRVKQIEQKMYKKAGSLDEYLAEETWKHWTLKPLFTL
jgi:hypothetical protein